MIGAIRKESDEDEDVVHVRRDEEQDGYAQQSEE
jgi:hypothetical protein